MAGGRITAAHFVRGEPQLRTRGMIVSPSVIVYAWYMVRHSRGSYMVCIPIAVSGSGHTRKTNEFIGRCYPCARKSASQAVLRRMQVTLHVTPPTPHGASRSVQAVCAWSVKTRRTPSRHCRDARVYGHTTTAMHNISTPPPLVCCPALSRLRTRFDAWLMPTDESGRRKYI